MQDLSEMFFSAMEFGCERKDKSSLTGTLEMIVGGYCVEGELRASWHVNNWIRVYCDEAMHAIDEDNLKKFAIPENLVAYVSLHNQKAFILASMYEKLQKDLQGYGLQCFRCQTLDEENYYCSEPKSLPKEFQKITWLNDDFLYDENLDFDFQAFAKIDEGTLYLNPNHVSIKQIIEYVEEVDWRERR